MSSRVFICRDGMAGSAGMVREAGANPVWELLKVCLISGKTFDQKGLSKSVVRIVWMRRISSWVTSSRTNELYASSSPADYYHYQAAADGSWLSFLHSLLIRGLMTQAFHTSSLVLPFDLLTLISLLFAWNPRITPVLYPPANTKRPCHHPPHKRTGLRVASAEFVPSTGDGTSDNSTNRALTFPLVWYSEHDLVIAKLPSSVSSAFC